MGWGLLATYSLHGLLYSFVWLGQGTWVRWALRDTIILAGVIAFLFGGVICAMSCVWFRCTNYKVSGALKREECGGA
jgi:hypothetical protein